MLKNKLAHECERVKTQIIIFQVLSPRNSQKCLRKDLYSEYNKIKKEQINLSYSIHNKFYNWLEKEGYFAINSIAGEFGDAYVDIHTIKLKSKQKLLNKNSIEKILKYFSGQILKEKHFQISKKEDLEYKVNIFTSNHIVDRKYNGTKATIYFD